MIRRAYRFPLLSIVLGISALVAVAAGEDRPAGDKNFARAPSQSAEDSKADNKQAAAKEGAGKSSDKPAYDPIESYEPRTVEGFKVLVNKRFLDPAQRDLLDKTLRRLEDHCYRISQAVPAEALAKLRKIPIWVELSDPKFPCMCYHESPGWLAEHGLNPQKAGGVELANPKNFLSWTHEQPWMVLHEMAHGYHDQVLGFENEQVQRCFNQAVAGGKYESVLHWNGDKVRHYALSNDKEYFAEGTEAYFGANDFYPFVRSELKEHDPKLYELLEEMWGVKKR